LGLLNSGEILPLTVGVAPQLIVVRRTTGQPAPASLWRAGRGVAQFSGDARDLGTAVVEVYGGIAQSLWIDQDFC